MPDFLDVEAPLMISLSSKNRKLVMWMEGEIILFLIDLVLLHNTNVF